MICQCIPFDNFTLLAKVISLAKLPNEALP